MPLRDAPPRIQIDLGGEEVAKWVLRRGSDHFSLMGAPGRGNGWAAVGGSFPVYRDLPDPLHNPDPLPIPYLGEDTYITISIQASALGGDDWCELDTGQLAISAVCLLQSEGLPIGECTKLNIRIENH